MRFTCEKSTLVSAISVASRTVAQKSTLPAIEGIYCQASLDLQLTGYNLETAITVSAQADIQEQGACILPARLLFDIIRRLPEGPVSVRVDDHYKVNIRAGFSNFNISASNAEDYPELPDVESPQWRLHTPERSAGDDFRYYFRCLRKSKPPHPHRMSV